MRQTARSPHGFTLIETLMVLLTISALLAISMVVLPGVVGAAKSDSGTSQLASLLRTCREQSITQRRNMQVVFVEPDVARCFRRELDVDGAGAIIESGALTLVDEALLEQGVTYQRFPGIQPADTPNAFAAGNGPREFTGAGPWWFTPEGTFVDASGDVTNGTLFLGQAQRPETARAITVFGATALIETWQWNGSAWVE